MNKIVFFGSKVYDSESFDEVNKNFGMELKYFKSHISLDNVSLSKGATAVCVFVNDVVDEPILEALKQNGVKLIALRCAGFNNVDIEAAKRIGIKVVRVPAYSPHAVAEFTLGLILSLDRQIPRAVARTRDDNFSLRGLMGFDLYGKTIGIVGTGKIARVLIEILGGFGMKIIAYDPYPNQAEAERLHYEYVSLDELYAQSDIISLHCPLNESSKYMINSDSIAKMKDGVMIINTGRGGLIRTTDLIQGLKSRKVGSAALDVYEEESAFFYEDVSDRVMDDDTLARLLSFHNVIVTSHQAYFTREALSNIAQTTLQNVKDFAENKPLVNEVQ